MQIPVKYFLPVVVLKAIIWRSQLLSVILVVRHIITSPIEHHAVLHAVEHLNHEGTITTSFVKLLPDGHIDLDDLEKQLASHKERCLVS